jgi:hypothetical protein
MSFDGDISIHSVRDFRPDVFLEPEMELDPHISGGLKMYLARIVNVQPGKIANETARELVTSVADIDAVTRSAMLRCRHCPHRVWLVLLNHRSGQP